VKSTVHRAFWNSTLDELEREFEPGTTGLTAAEVAARLARYGPNRIERKGGRPLIVQFLARFKSPLVLLLLGASIVMGATGDVWGCAIVGVIVVMSVTLDFVQEHQAEKIVDALRRSIAVRARALRDGRYLDVDVDTLVPGDKVQLQAGDLIPADGRVLEAKDCFVNEAALTGEPYPVEKNGGDAPAPVLEIGEAKNAMFAGGSIVSGSATLLVIQTGASTQFGEIASSLAERRPPTAFETGVRRFGVLILRMTALLVIAVLVVNWSLHRPLLESLLFSVALAVGLTPELLPMIVTVTLSRGAARMAKRKVIVKQLEAIQNLGSMDILCTDKTGTLTEARVGLARAIDGRGSSSARVLELAYLNSWFETGLKSPLDDAILAQPGLSADGFRKIDEVPFDFERRRVSVLIEQAGERQLVVKGAPEDVLKTCAELLLDDEVQRLDESALKVVSRTHDELAAQGFRLLGVAYRTVSPEQSHARVEDESSLIFAGYAAFLDPPKADAAEALAALRNSGVAVKIVTGDNELVTRHVCECVDLEITGVLTGHDVAELDDPALAARAESADIFCRVTPLQKNRIIQALKLRGHTVGYLGDGINDAPSLHSADIGISVDGAVDVAKSAASIVLLEHDLDVLHAGIIEGRRTFANVMKYIMMATSSNFGNMFSMAGAALLLPFLPMLPVQILLNNLLYDTSELALPFDTVDAKDLERPRRWSIDTIRRFMLFLGPVSSVFDFLTFYLLLVPFAAGEHEFQTGWFVESIATQVLVVFVIRTAGSPWRSRPSPGLIAASVGVIGVAVALPYLPIGRIFGFVALPPSYLAVLGLVVITYLALAQRVKSWLVRRESGRRTITNGRDHQGARA
jgi:P-type Mg2+ transporter